MTLTRSQKVRVRLAIWLIQAVRRVLIPEATSIEINMGKADTYEAMREVTL